MTTTLSWVKCSGFTVICTTTTLSRMKCRFNIICTTITFSRVRYNGLTDICTTTTLRRVKWELELGSAAESSVAPRCWKSETHWIDWLRWPWSGFYCMKTVVNFASWSSQPIGNLLRWSWRWFYHVKPRSKRSSMIISANLRSAQLVHLRLALIYT